MITYTKKNVTILAFLITLLIFILIYLANYFYFMPQYYEPSNTIPLSKTVYSKVIPISVQEKENFSILPTNHFPKRIRTLEEKQLETNAETKEGTQIASTVMQTTNSSNASNSKTQRETVKENEKIAWRIQIPKINLDVHIKEGTDSNVLLEAVGHFETTSKWNGNVGLAAHNRGYQCNFFQKIKNLAIGDEIIYATTNGKKVYKVQTNKVILETDWSYLEPSQENKITLITCEENRREYRRCVQAIEVANY